jgi:hypothetical protein
MAGIIAVDTFLTRVTALNLQLNEITDLPSGLFDPLVSLTYLCVEGVCGCGAHVIMGVNKELEKRGGWCMRMCALLLIF